jgi:very-short-patch-repair endonuclease
VDTEAEEIFKSLLEANNIKYQQEVILGRFRADFIIDNFIYEINGGYHGLRKQRRKDKTRATYLLKRGYEIKEISNDDVFKCKAGEIALCELIKGDRRSIKEKFIVPKKKKRVCAKAKEYRRKAWKEAYQKKKLYLKSNRV